MPVRVKHRAVVSVNGGDEKQLEALKKQVVGLLLAWHRPVSISLKDTESSKKLGIRGKQGLKKGKAGDERSTRKLDLSLVCGILSQAGCIEPSSWDEWIKASARTPFITIRGAISIQPAPSKQVQFISLGIHSINAETDGNVLYDEVNRLFASSSFGNHDEISDNEEGDKVRRSKDRRFKQDGYTNKQLKGGGKGVDRWPMFYIRVELENLAPEYGEGVDRLREGTLSSILKLVGAMITGFLEGNHFRPRARTKRGGKNTLRKSSTSAKSPSLSALCEKKHSPNVTNDSNQEHDLGTWSRIKSGTRVIRQAAKPPLDSLQSQETPIKRVPSLVPERVLEPAVASEPSPPSDNTDINPSNGQDSEQTIQWRDPISGATVLINARTGLVLAPQTSRRPSTAPSGSNTSAPLSATCAHTNANSSTDKRLTRSASLPFRTAKAGSWSSELLKRWENPVFDITEVEIPQVSLDGPSIETSDILHGRRHCCTDVDIQKAFTQSSFLFAAKLSKQALKHAKVVAQVDQKFILIGMNEGSSAIGETDGQLLVLVDQHAADERIRVEGLLADLSSSLTPLAKPIIFEIPAREHELLISHVAYFASWGITYSVNAVVGSSKCRLKVKTLPAAIAEKCRVESKVLIEMLRGEAWKREESGRKHNARHDLELPSPNASKNDGWLARLGSCPQGLLNMLNSRACRSAIMFNDELTVSECRTLIKRLGDCAFPFQCAHGRPSMIPLVDLGSGDPRGKVGNAFGARKTESTMQERVFGEAWKRWKPLNKEDIDTM